MTSHIDAGKEHQPGAKILLVEDSRLIRKWTSDVLASAGYHVIESDNMWVSEEIRTHQPNLILMDINLGTATSGIIAAKSLKKNIAAKIPVVFYTASRNAAELVNDVRDSGADGYIQKNQDPVFLLKEVAKYLTA